MKKLLLFAAAALTAGFAFAQDDVPAAEGGFQNINKRCADAGLEKNFVVNGNFEDPNYVSTGDPYGDWYPVRVDELTELPGWTISTGGCWNGVIEVKTQTPDGYMIFEGNNQYLHMLNCTTNGWTNICARNTVTGLVPGKEYVLDFYVCHQFTDPTEWGNPDHGFKIYGKDPAGEGALGALLYSNNELSAEAEWEYQKFTFTPVDDEVTLEFWTHNYTGEGNQSGLCWADFDEVRVFDDSTADYTVPNPETGIQFIDQDNAPLEYYTLQGVRMPAGAALHGTFIAKQGNRVHKVYVR